MQPAGPGGFPATITRPRTSSALAKIEPISEVCATTSSPDPSANSTMKNSGRFPSVDCRNPVTAGPNRRPTCSVARATTQAKPASASAAAAKAITADALEYRSTPAIAVIPVVAPRKPRSLPLTPGAFQVESKDPLQVPRPRRALMHDYVT